MRYFITVKLSNILKLNKVHYIIITKYTIYILTLLQHLVSEMIFDRDFYINATFGRNLICQRFWLIFALALFISWLQT